MVKLRILHPFQVGTTAAKKGVAKVAPNSEDAIDLDLNYEFLPGGTSLGKDWMVTITAISSQIKSRNLLLECEHTPISFYYEYLVFVQRRGQSYWSIVLL